MENLSLLELAAAGLVVMVAFGVRGTAGFGVQAIAVPLLTLMLPMMLIGTRIGNLLAGRIDQHVFNVSVALVLTVSGTALLFK